MDEVHVLAYCEQKALILKPNVLYKFVPVEGCSKCDELLALYTDH